MKGNAMFSNTLKILCALLFCGAMLAQAGCGMCGTAKGCAVAQKAPCDKPRATCDTASFTVTSPNGGECWEKGTTHTITWKYTGGDSTVGIALHNGSTSTGQITSSAPNDGSYSWTIPSDSVTGSNFKIRVVGNQSGSGDYSDSTFTLR
jgi:hypothetical protein